MKAAVAAGRQRASMISYDLRGAWRFAICAAACAPLREGDGGGSRSGRPSLFVDAGVLGVTRCARVCDSMFGVDVQHRSR